MGRSKASKNSRKGRSKKSTQQTTTAQPGTSDQHTVANKQNVEKQNESSTHPQIIQTTQDQTVNPKVNKKQGKSKRKRESSTSESDSSEASSSSSSESSGKNISKKQLNKMAKKVAKIMKKSAQPQPSVIPIMTSNTIPDNSNVNQGLNTQFRPAPYPRATPAGTAPGYEQGQWNARQMNAITLCGTTVPTKLQQKIMEDKYVDLRSLLPNSSRFRANKVIRIGEDENYCKLLVNDHDEDCSDKKELTKHQWIACFHDYMGIYIKAYPEAIGDLLAYSKYINKMMDLGHDWRNYDTMFRKARDTTPYLWTDLLMDLRVEASSNTSVKSSQQFTAPNNKSQFFRRDHNIRAGYCYKYHDARYSCTIRNCTFKHNCQICGQGHPLFRHPHFEKPREPHQYRKREGSPNANKKDPARKTPGGL